MPQRIKMVERDPNVRNKDFEEVNLGYSDEQALTEAKRCLQCPNPRCMTGCPVHTPIKQVIGLFRSGHIEEAGKLLINNNPLSLICSYICPQESQCEGHCVLGIKGIPNAKQ